MSRRAALWIAFAVVHLGIAVLGFVLPNQPMGDVYRVYEPWSAAWLHSGYSVPGNEHPLTYIGFVGITETWVYPQLALAPMLLAWLFAWAGSYTVGWAILVTFVDAAAFAILVGRGRSAGRSRAAWFWLAFLALLGPIAMYRIDAVTVPLAIAGCLWLAGRPWLAGTLLAIATWMKVWPAALVAAAVIALRRRLAVIASGLLVTIATLAVIVLSGGAAHAFGFVTDQTGRGIQLEAPVGAVYLWRAVAEIPGSFIYYDRDLLTFQLAGPDIETVIGLMTPVLAVAAAAVMIIGVVKVRRGARFAALFPVLALSLVLALIVFNKVGSPQFMTWLVAPIVLGLVLDRRRWRSVAVFALVVAALTQSVYPLTYDGLLLAAPFPALLLTVRNALLVAGLGWMLVRLVRVPSAD